MDLQSVLKTIISSRGLSYRKIGDMLGGITSQGVSSRLNTPHSLSVAMLLRYLDILECELIIRSKRENDDCWLITQSITDKGGGQNV